METYSIPISVKGIVIENNKVWLRKNERNEWELPGGKLDENEQPEETVVREIKEELGFLIKPIRILQAYKYTIKTSNDEQKGVLVVTYICEIFDKIGGFEVDSEAGKAQFYQFSVEEIDNLNMPEFYKQSIKNCIS